MKFLSLALFASSVAAQASVIEDAISSISDATSALQSAVAAFSGVDQAADLQAASQAVIDAINQGNSDVEPIEPLGDEAINLAGPVQSLADLTGEAVQTTIDQRPAFDEAGVSGIVLDQLTAIRDAASTFSETVLSKIPEELRTIAEGIASQITDALNRGVQEYSNAGDGGDGGDDSSSSSSAEPTGSSSEYPTGSAPAPTGTGSMPVPTGTGGAPAPTAAPTAPSPPITTGAAAANVANFGAVAAAALLVAAF